MPPTTPPPFSPLNLNSQNNSNHNSTLQQPAQQNYHHHPQQYITISPVHSATSNISHTQQLIQPIQLNYNNSKNNDNFILSSNDRYIANRTHIETKGKESWQSIQPNPGNSSQIHIPNLTTDEDSNNNDNNNLNNNNDPDSTNNDNNNNNNTNSMDYQHSPQKENSRKIYSQILETELFGTVSIFFFLHCIFFRLYMRVRSCKSSLRLPLFFSQRTTYFFFALINKSYLFIQNLKPPSF